MRICSCPYNHYVVNFSLTSGQFHPIMKESIISPLPTKSAWDKDELSNYRSISNLSIISKTTERVVNNTQLFFSSHPLNFDSSISHPENALQQISSRITFNFLTINSFKTEFLLIWLKKQLAKIHTCNSSFSTSHSARHLGFIFDKHLTSGQTTSLSKFCCYHYSNNLILIPFQPGFLKNVLQFLFPLSLA